VQVVRIADPRVGEDLVARLHGDEVADDDLAGRHLMRLPVADGRRPRRDQQREAIERPLGSDLLDDPDAGVGEQRPEEQRVAPVAEHERENAEHRQDQVNSVKTLARTMLAYERLLCASRTPPAASSRCCASASVSPAAGACCSLWIAAGASIL
jgi:hypothetical protein